ncbi:MAG: hypothetical protein ACRC8K_12825 [Waterburya sp.]
MNQTKTEFELEILIRDCKYPLQISFTLDVKEGVYLLSIGYLDTFPVIAKYQELPQDLHQAVLDLLPQFDIQAKNKELTQKALTNNGDRPVQSLTNTSNKPKRQAKTKKVKFNRSLI